MTTLDSKAKRDALLYNLLPGERQKIAAFQGGRDPITDEELKPNANLDHDHKSGLVRGLLNPWTNKELIDNVSKLERMLAYVTDPPAPKALGETVYGLIGRAQRKKRMRYGPNGDNRPQPRTLAVRPLSAVDIQPRQKRSSRTRSANPEMGRPGLPERMYDVLSPEVRD